MMSDLITALIFVMASLILIQSLILVVVSIGIHRKVSRLSQRAKSASRRLSRALQGFQEALRRVEPVLEGLPAWNRVLVSATEKVVRSADRTDAVIEAALQKVRVKFESFTDQSDRALVTMSEISRQVQCAVCEPSRRLSRAIVSLGDAIPGWGQKRASQAPQRHHADEELFI